MRVATLLGQTVVRGVIGEGRARSFVSAGDRSPSWTPWSGNGATSMVDLRREGFRARTCAMLLVAPTVSFGLAAVAWWTSARWPLPP